MLCNWCTHTPPIRGNVSLLQYSLCHRSLRATVSLLYGISYGVLKPHATYVHTCTHISDVPSNSLPEGRSQALLIIREILVALVK